jgi:hypothetical protein
MSEYVDLVLSLEAADRAGAEFRNMKALWQASEHDPRVHAALVRVRTAYSVVADNCADLLAKDPQPS